MLVDIENTERDILRTIRAAKQHQHGKVDATHVYGQALAPHEVKASYFHAQVGEAVENLRKFEHTGFRKYFDTAINILQEMSVHTRGE